VYSLRKGMTDIMIYREKEVFERYELKPEQMIDYKGLRGDPSDNIPGVVGVGEKTAINLLKEFRTIENLYNKIEKITDKQIEEHKFLTKKLVERLKENKEMAFLTLGDSTGSIERVIFPNVFEKYKEFIESKDVVVISGRVNGGKILADKIMNPQDFKKEASSQMHIFLNSSFDFEQLVKLRDIFLKKKGKCNIFLHMPELEKHKKAIKASAFLLVDPDEELISTLKREKVVEKVWVS
ncbi:hypothetical protein LCGC14_2311270, partial [marine sediment metagenome]